jgi:hypothetical protein
MPDTGFLRIGEKNPVRKVILRRRETSARYTAGTLADTIPPLLAGERLCPLPVRDRGLADF